MGDVLTLIEKAEASFDQEEAIKAAAKLKKGSFTLEDFLEQMQQVKKMGPLQNIIGMIPGMPKELKNTQIDDKELGKVEAIIRSMTPAGAQRHHDHQRLPPPADRPGQRHDHPGRQRPAEAVQDGPGDDEADGRGGGQKGSLPEDAEHGRFPGDVVGPRRCCNLSRLSLKAKVVVPW